MAFADHVLPSLQLGQVGEVQWILATDDFVTIPATVLNPRKPSARPVTTSIRLPAGGADVSTLWWVLWPDLPEGVPVLETREGKGLVPLSAKDVVSGPVTLTAIRGRPLPFYARLTRRECSAAQRYVRSFFQAPHGQRLLDELECKSSGDELRYGALLCSLLGKEVYPSMLRTLGIPGGAQPLQVAMHCLNWSHLDMESCRQWFEAECLMRNRKKACESRGYLVYYNWTLGLPPPTWELLHTSGEGCSRTIVAKTMTTTGTDKETGEPALPFVQIVMDRGKVDDCQEAGDCREAESCMEVIPLSVPHMTLKGLANHLAEEGWAHIPQVGMPTEDLLSAQHEAEALESAMHPGRSTDDFTAKPGFLLRSDRILWLYDGVLRDLPSLRRLSLGVAGFVKRFVQDVDVEITAQEAPMLAAYDKGSFFRRHVDATTGRSAERVLTAVYYLNRDWDASKGGALRIAPGSKDYTDILPHGDSLVIFRSDTVEHEVQVAQAKRRALTIWFRGSYGGPSRGWHL